VKKIDLELKQSMPIEEAVGIAVGCASMCWKPNTGDALFDTESAKQVVDQLVAYIEMRIRDQG
jgi:hypothetical protein